MIKCTKGQVRQLKTALRWKIPPEQRQRIQMVLLRESGMTQPLIAAAMGVSLSTVNRAHMTYDHGGIKALKPRRFDSACPRPAKRANVRRALIRGSHVQQDPFQYNLKQSQRHWRVPTWRRRVSPRLFSRPRAQAPRIASARHENHDKRQEILASRSI